MLGQKYIFISKWNIFPHQTIEILDCSRSLALLQLQGLGCGCGCKMRGKWNENENDVAATMLELPAGCHLDNLEESPTVCPVPRHSLIFPSFPPSWLAFLLEIYLPAGSGAQESFGGACVDILWRVTPREFDSGIINRS